MKTLTPAEAEQAGYEGYARHSLYLPCPRAEDPRVYCATCQGTLADLLDPPLPNPDPED